MFAALSLTWAFQDGYVEDIGIYFLSGHEFKGPVSEKDMDRIAQEIMEYNPEDYLY